MKKEKGAELMKETSMKEKEKLLFIPFDLRHF